MVRSRLQWPCFVTALAQSCSLAHSLTLVVAGHKPGVRSRDLILGGFSWFMIHCAILEGRWGLLRTVRAHAGGYSLDLLSLLSRLLEENARFACWILYPHLTIVHPTIRFFPLSFSLLNFAFLRVVIDFTMRLEVFLYFYDLCAHKPENCKLQKELHNMARIHIFKGRDYKQRCS